MLWHMMVHFHGTKFLHHGILWFTMVHPLLKYTIDYSIVCQNVGYHSTVYHAFIIVYFVPFTLWWMCIMYIMFGTKGLKKKERNKQKSHTHTKMFWLWYNVSLLFCVCGIFTLNRKMLNHFSCKLYSRIYNSYYIAILYRKDSCSVYIIEQLLI